MKQKIEWYQEVLELEPGSKVFFPLAKMLAEDGQADAAIAALRRGVDRHPEFVEARLYLVELLHQNGRDDIRNEEAQRLAAMFSSYPAFWSAWGSMAFDKDNHPQGAALYLLSAALRDKNLSWDEIIDQGIRSLTEDMTTDAGVPLFSAPNSGASTRPVYTEAAPKSAAPRPQPAIPVLESEIPQPSATPQNLAAEAYSGEDDGEDTTDEQLSVRTRSMAEVLVEQGDFKGAKEIYEELLNAQPDGPDAPELEHRISELENRLQASGAPAKVEEPEAPAPGKNKVVNMLQLLASRLEDRAG